MTPVDNRHSELNSVNQLVLHFRYLSDETFLLNFLNKYFSIILSKASEHQFSKSKAFTCGLFLLTTLSGA